MTGLNLDEIESDHEEVESFTLGGRDWHCRSAEDVRPGVIAQLFNRQATTIADAVQVGPMFRALIAEDEWGDFEAMMNAEDSPLTRKRANLLVPYLVEKVLGIPTEPPKPSTPGRRSRNTGSKSKAGSSSRVTRRRAS